MDGKEQPRSVLYPIGDIDPVNPACPQCQTQDDLLIGGRYVRPFERALLAGEVNHSQIDTDYTEEVSYLICRKCEIRFVLQKAEMISMINENFQLWEKVGEKAGHLVKPIKSDVN